MFSLTSQRIDGPCIVVKDVLEALSILAAFVRKRLDKLIVIGITGSQGKTSTKDLLTHMLGAVGPTVAPAGSFNNDLGLPITLLQCDDRTRFCILEMGARHMGDIARLCEIAKPNIGVVLTVGTAHIGEFGSREIIAKTKGELIESLGKDGVAILGTYDEFTPKMASLHQGQVIFFGESADIQVRAADIEMREGRPHFDLVTPAGRDAVGMRAVGAHQVSNALAVAAVGTALSLPLELIASSLSTAEISSKWRMELHEIADLLIINDAYNANPESMSAAMRAFVGKMNELGQTQAPQSAAIGALAVELGIDHLVEINAPEYGEPGGAMVIHQRPTIESAVDLVDYFAPGDVVLVKASRSQGFEVLAESLERAWKEKSGVDS